MDLAGSTRSRVAALGAATLILVSGCGGSAPSGSTTSGSAAPSPGAPGAVPSSGSTDGIALVEFAETSDPSAAAHRELDLVHEVRDDAGMPALIGESGPAAFVTLDQIEAGFGQAVLEAASAGVASGAIPRLASTDPLAGQLAASGSDPALRAAVPAAIDISLFADTGFTANAILGLLTGLVERAAESQSGSIPQEEHFDQTADGLRQQVDLQTNMTIQTGGGRVNADITMSATDRISRPDGTFVALYTSTAHGHFDVNACPDRSGIGAGTYTFETKHELNDVSGAANSRSGAGRSVEAPFSLINGDDAKLQRIEASLDLSADAHGPGTPGGPGPTGAFDWGASQQVRLVMPRGGGTTAGTGGAAAITGSGGAGAGGALFLSSAMAQLFLTEVGKEAERFWRSGKCIELEPSDDTRKVEPKEQIDLTVEAKHKFDGQPVEAPIVATFSGKESLAPKDEPVDVPAHFTFIAGEEKDDKGTIELKQTSKRGIGLRKVEFTVDVAKLQIAIDSRVKLAAGATSYDSKIKLPLTDLASAEGGGYEATATVTWTTLLTAPECKPKTYDGSFESKINVRVDEADPDRVLVKAGMTPGPITTETIICGGRAVSFPGTTFLGGWAFLGTEHVVPIDGSADVNSALPGGIGTSKTTITIKKKPQP
jgi:hypothetical protein